MWSLIEFYNWVSYLLHYYDHYLCHDPSVPAATCTNKLTHTRACAWLDHVLEMHGAHAWSASRSAWKWWASSDLAVGRNKWFVYGSTSIDRTVSQWSGSSARGAKDKRRSLVESELPNVTAPTNTHKNSPSPSFPRRCPASVFVVLPARWNDRSCGPSA